MSQVYHSWVHCLVTILVVFLVSGANVYAQDQYALLTHKGETTVFRGPDALIDAADRADEGDVITLSEGQFKGTVITRNITLRGAGMGINGEKSTLLTYNSNINGTYEYYSLKIESPDDGGVLVENLACGRSGINIKEGNRVDLVRCKSQLRFDADENHVKEMRIINCVIENGIDSSTESNMPLVTGSVIIGKVYGIKADHCVIMGENGSTANVNGSTLSNSVVGCTATAHECVWINCVLLVPEMPTHEMIAAQFNEELGAVSQTNKVFVSGEIEAFKEGPGLYELTDANASSWLCEDGTQVGIYGGSLPFGTLSNILTIKSLKVAEKTDTEGMLKLEVEIE